MFFVCSRSNGWCSLQFMGLTEKEEEEEEVEEEEKKEGEEKENGEEEERDCGSSYKLEIFSMQKESVLNIASVPFGHIHGLDLD